MLMSFHRVQSLPHNLPSSRRMTKSNSVSKTELHFARTDFVWKKTEALFGSLERTAVYSGEPVALSMVRQEAQNRGI